jgi:hypothetical protein
MSNAKELANFARDITYDTANTELSGITVQGAGGASVTTAATAPASPSNGDVWFNTTNNSLNVFYNTAWTQSSGGSTTTRVIDTFTATAGQTTFVPSVNYSYVEVYKNNVRVPTNQYVATDGVSVVLNTGATAGDVLEIYAYATVGGTATGTGGLSINSVIVTDASGTALGYAGFAEVGGGYVKVTGTGFSSGISATIGGTAALSTVYNSSTEIIVRVPPKAYGSYGITLTDLLGFTVSLTNAVIYYPAASWVTETTLPDVQMDIPVSIQLQAVGGTAFALASGSTLPAGLTLNTVSGLISGTLTVFSGDSFTTSFAVNVTNNVGVTTSRTFNLFANAARFETAAIAGSTAINRYWIFENAGTLHRFKPPHFGIYDMLLVGGGGSGGNATANNINSVGGGGGAGGVAEKLNTILNSSSSVYYQKVSFIRVTSGGTGYSSAPTVVITPASGNTPTVAATATATISGGAVTSISVTGNGVGYTSAPTISFTGGAGSGAQAIAYIGGNDIFNINVGAGGSGSTGGSTSIRKNALPVDWIGYGGGYGNASSGGSGGGAGGPSDNGGITTVNGGAALQPGSATGGFGNSGGQGESAFGVNNTKAGGSGGGASSAGAKYGNGGAGRLMTGWEIRGTNSSNTLTGTRGYYGGGGANMFSYSSGPSSFNETSVGGVGGGGNSGATRNGINGTGGGGGGGGGSVGPGGLGGSGILIIKQKYGYDADILLAGGGGSGPGNASGGSSAGGGGGAGGMVYTTGNQFNVLPGETYTVTIGGSDTSSTLVHANYTLTAYGGGGGARDNNNAPNYSGSPGGSGGGACGGGSGGASTQVSNVGYGNGNRGGDGNGGGGGAGGPASGGTGGPGIQWLNGVTYCRGGTQDGRSAGAANTGNGANSTYGTTTGFAGGSGVFIIRYAGAQRGTGGTITSVDGYTYHTFTTSGVFTG